MWQFHGETSKQRSACGWKSPRLIPVVVQAVKHKGRERSSVPSHRHALCGGPFPAFPGNSLIENRFSLTDELSQSPAETTISCSGQCTEEEEETVGEGSFETHLPVPTGCGVNPSLVLLFLRPHIFSFPCSLFFFFLSPLAKLPAFPPHVRLTFHCEVMFGFSYVNTREPVCVEEPAWPRQLSEGPTELWSNGTARVQT